MGENLNFDVEIDIETATEGLEVVVQDADVLLEEIESDEVEVEINAEVEVMREEEYEYVEPEMEDPAKIEAYEKTEESD